MVSFNWSWADYERMKREEERKAARLASGSRPSIEEPKPEVAPPAPPPEPEPEPEPETEPQPLQYCGACGKKRLSPCSYGGCPLL